MSYEHYYPVSITLLPIYLSRKFCLCYVALNCAHLLIAQGGGQTPKKTSYSSRAVAPKLSTP